jgi:hypothetical protein
MGDYMPTRPTLVGLFVMLLTPALAAAEAPRRIAVMLPEGDAPPALAQRVAGVFATAAGQGGGHEVLRPAVPLEEVRLTVDCPEPSPACNAVVGRNLGADELVLTRITRQGDGWEIQATRFEVGEAREARQVQRRVAAAPTDAELTQMGQELFTSAVAPAPAAPRHPFTVRPRTWITGAAGAALLIMGGVFGALAQSKQSSLDSAALPAAGDFAAIHGFVNLADTGQAYATAANVLFAMGGATLVASGVLLYLDNRHVEVQPTRGGLAFALRGRF